MGQDRGVSGARNARVFYALWPDSVTAQALEAIANAVAREACGHATVAKNLHVTLAFVGAVPAREIDTLVAIGTDVARGIPPFALALDYLGGVAGAGIAWAGASVTPEALQCLVDRLRRALTTAMLPVDTRTFKPHLTLARRCRRLPRRSELRPTILEVGSFTLTVSTTTLSGSQYTILREWTLDGTV